jgi:hypothetical protein
MDFDGTTDHATRKIVELHIFVLFVFFVVLYSRRRLVEPVLDARTNNSVMLLRCVHEKRYKPRASQLYRGNMLPIG